MNIKTLVLASVGALALSFHASDAAAWGGQGHRLVARIADDRLSPQAHAEVARLLAGEEDPSLAGIASWADQLRAHDPDLGKRTARWHYVNLGEHDCGYEPPRDCPDGNCAIEALKTQTAILADHSKSLADRRQALKFVVHLVGDIHQPMHAGYAHDKGGNDFQLQYNKRGTNLHSLWDSGMLYSQGLSDDAYLQRLLALPAPSKDQTAVLPPAAASWAEASCRVAVAAGTYPATHVLNQAYVDKYLPVAEADLRQAGERLAAILNATLGH